MDVVVPVAVLLAALAVGERLDRVDAVLEMRGLAGREVLEELGDRPASRLGRERLTYASRGRPISRS
jgi:hypothetical protein